MTELVCRECGDKLFRFGFDAWCHNLNCSVYHVSIIPKEIKDKNKN